MITDGYQYSPYTQAPSQNYTQIPSELLRPMVPQLEARCLSQVIDLSSNSQISCLDYRNL